MEEKQANNATCQVLVTNIKWHKDTISQYHVKHDKYENLPTQFTLDIPENILNQKSSKFNLKDTVESFVFNLLTRKCGHEVNDCQIWLPLEDNN